MTSLSVRLVAALLACAALFSTASARAQDAIADRTKAMTKIDGFVPLYWEAGAGKIFMEIGRFDTELLYAVSLPAGVGSNPIGLDRGQLGPRQVVVFERVGPRVLMVARNHRYRALSDNAAERRAVEDSFARSVLWGFAVEATAGDRVLVDATPLVLRDAHGVADRLRQRRQGQYRFDASRSAVYLPRTKGFPRNTEIEATITLTTDGDPGPLVAQVTPAPESVTVRQHHSFVELPPLGSYRPRRHDVRVGVNGMVFHDYASPVTEPVERRVVTRHHLRKKDPAAAVSDPVEPIVYYVDNGAPEPIRSALVEGASWWAQAFEAAGFRNAFLVKVLPEDADPMDVRYNMIHWVHRSTRGWSYGASLVDPRTGQILKGNVSLGSLRVRQDHMLATGLVDVASASGAAAGFEGLCDAGAAGDDEHLAALDPTTDALAMSLARIRQLSAHEVGHTLGFAHNFAASTYDGRASVMDYPAPLVKLTGGRIDLSDAYGRGIGSYDTWAARYAYAEPGTPEGEADLLESILRDGIAAGHVYITDEDARPAGASHPLASLWDNGSDAVAELRHAMRVRQIGLEAFGLENIAVGAPLTQLEAKLVPLYLHHRYQLQAAAKTLGGLSYSYAVRAAEATSPPVVQQIVPAARQREALAAVLETLRPEALALPARVLALVPPPAADFGGPNTELFPGHAGPAFDPVGVATLAADLAVSALLQPQRAARLIDFHARDAAMPSFREVTAALVDQLWHSPSPADPHQALLLRATREVALARLMDLAADADASPLVREDAEGALRDLAARLGQDSATSGHIRRFLSRPEQTYKRTAPLPAPPGDPIGGR
jgi:hypothetical protein